MSLRGMLQCGLSRQAVISCSAGHSDGGIFHLELHIDMIKFEGHVACYLGGQAVVSLSGGHPYGKAFLHKSDEVEVQY